MEKRTFDWVKANIFCTGYEGKLKENFPSERIARVIGACYRDPGSYFTGPRLSLWEFDSEGKPIKEAENTLLQGFPEEVIFLLTFAEKVLFAIGDLLERRMVSLELARGQMRQLMLLAKMPVTEEISLIADVIEDVGDSVRSADFSSEEKSAAKKGGVKLAEFHREAGLTIARAAKLVGMLDKERFQQGHGSYQSLMSSIRENVGRIGCMAHNASMSYDMLERCIEAAMPCLAT